jgi:hypothetical protein
MKQERPGSLSGPFLLMFAEGEAVQLPRVVLTRFR